MSKKTFIFLVSGLIIALGFFVVQAAGPSLESSKNLTVPAASTIIFQGTTPTSINWSSYGGYSLTAGLATNASACTGDSNCDMPGSGIWNSSGNVGIGDTSPNEKLDVAGNIQAGMETSNTANIKLDIANAGSPQFSISDTNGDNYWALGADDADNSFKILGSASAMPTINNLTTPFFTITTAGNVGIVATYLKYKTRFYIFFY